MNTFSYTCFSLLLLLLLLLFLTTQTDARCRHMPSPGAPTPAPSRLQLKDFVNEKQHKAYLVIQSFKGSITSDPKNITGTWVGPHVCDYKGFHCAAPPDAPDASTIASIDISGFKLGAPTICGFLDRLPDLAIFHANGNNFSGTLPMLSGVPFLYEVDVSDNRMEGPFPAAAVMGIKELVFLDLRFNLFSGRVPPSVFVIKLDVLFLNDNLLGDPLPENLGSTTAKYLTLANNGFTGPIPRSIGDAADTLVEVLFLNNNLSGHLPCEIGLLKNATVFDAGDNRITGGIPKSFGCLRNIEQLNLANNLLYGEIPESVCQLPNLQNLTLSGNYFTSIGSSCLKLWKQKKLHLGRNCILRLPHHRSLHECSPYASKPKPGPERCSLPCKPSPSALPPSYISAPAPSPSYPPSYSSAPAPSPAYSALVSQQPY